MQKVHVTPWITAFWLKEFRGLCSSTPLIAVRMQDGKTQDWGSIPGLPAVICDFGWLTDFSDPRILSCKMYMTTLLATYQDESEWIFVRYNCLGTAGLKNESDICTSGGFRPPTNNNAIQELRWKCYAHVRHWYSCDYCSYRLGLFFFSVQCGPSKSLTFGHLVSRASILRIPARMPSHLSWFITPPRTFWKYHFNFFTESMTNTRNGNWRLAREGGEKHAY